MSRSRSLVKARTATGVMMGLAESELVAQTRVTVQTESDVVSRALHQGLFGPLNQFLDNQGRRIRADLVTLAYRTAGGRGAVPTEIIDFIELLHGGSLIVDDIEDDSANRRGRPAMFRSVGLPLALNTANWMYFAALERLMEISDDPQCQAQVMQSALATIRACHEGQAIDLGTRIDQIKQAEVTSIAEAISQMKTAGLTALAARLGAIAAGAEERVVESLSAFGFQLGMVLQMKNDLGEVASCLTDSVRDDDLRNARVTWPWAWASDICDDAAYEALIQRLQNDMQSTSTTAGALLDAIGDSGRKAITLRLGAAMAILECEFGGVAADGLNQLLEKLGNQDA